MASAQNVFSKRRRRALVHEKALTDSLREQGHGAGETSHARKASQYTVELGYTTLAHWICSWSAASSCVGGLGWLLSQMADFVVPLYVTALEPGGEPYTLESIFQTLFENPGQKSNTSNVTPQVLPKRSMSEARGGLSSGCIRVPN